MKTSCLTVAFLLALGTSSAAEPPPAEETPSIEAPGEPAEEPAAPANSVPAPEEGSASGDRSSPKAPGLWSEDTWDLMVELGAGVDSNDPRGFFGRARGGWMWIRYPVLAAVGGAVEVGPHGRFGAGVHGEVANIGNGLWANGGATLDLEGHLAGTLGVGWSLFGAEVRVQQTATDPVLEFYGKLRVPIRLLIMALSQ